MSPDKTHTAGPDAEPKQTVPVTSKRAFIILSDLFVTLRSFSFVFLRTIGLSKQYPYKVLLCGEPLWCCGPDGGVEEIGGFYATRWVMASSRQQAIVRALAVLNKEMAVFMRNPAESPVRMQVEGCWKIDGFMTSSGHGFAFWQKE